MRPKKHHRQNPNVTDAQTAVCIITLPVFYLINCQYSVMALKQRQEHAKSVTAALPKGLLQPQQNAQNAVPNECTVVDTVNRHHKAFTFIPPSTGGIFVSEHMVKTYSSDNAS